MSSLANLVSGVAPLRVALLILVLILGVVACRPGDEITIVVTEVITMGQEEVVVTRLIRQTVPPSATQDPELGGPTILDISYPGSPSPLDPQTVTSSPDLTLVENLFVGLTQYNHASDTVEPSLAREWEISPDGRTWTFHLRNDVFWMRSPFEQRTLSLGQPGVEVYRQVVAEDMVAAVHRLCADFQSSTVFVFFIIDGCEAVHSIQEPTEADLAGIGVRALDETTLEFRLTEPSSQFLTMTSLWYFRPLPAELIEEYAGSEESWAMLENVVTSGPFILGQESVEDERTVLLRNPLWPIPFEGNVDQVNIWWLPNDSAGEMWLAKDLDISPLSFEMREMVQASPNLRSRLHLVSNQRVFYLAFNFDSPIFAEESVRRAFSAAIDREALIEEVFVGTGEPLRHLSPPGVVGAPPLDLVGVGYNPDLARIEMANSSFRDCRFMPTVHYLVGTNDLDLFQAEMIRSMWIKELNCLEEQIVIDQVQFGTLLANTRQEAGSERPDMWNLGWVSFYPDAHNWLSDVLHCQRSENRPNRPCSEVDTMLQRARTTQDISERWDIYRQAENLFFGENGINPIAPLLVQGNYLLVQSWVEYAPAHFGGERFDTYLVAADVKELERQQ